MCREKVWSCSDRDINTSLSIDNQKPARHVILHSLPSYQHFALLPACASLCVCYQRVRRFMIRGLANGLRSRNGKIVILTILCTYFLVSTPPRPHPHL